MPKKPLKTTARAKNTPMIGIGLGVFLILAVFFGPGPAAASISYFTSFEENEGFFLGPINGQNNFISYGGDPDLTISSTTAQTGLWSFKADSFLGRYISNSSVLEPMGVGNFSFWAFTTSTQDFKILLNASSTLPVPGTCLLTTNACLDVEARLSPGSWHYVLIKWDIPNSQLLAYVDGSNITGLPWYFLSDNFISYPTDELKYISAFGLANSYSGPFYFDDLSWGLSYDVIAGVAPVFPIGETTISGGIFNAVGTYSYSTSSDFFISDLGLVFTNATNAFQYVYNFDISSSTAGSYSAPVKLNDGIYDLKYRFVYNVSQISIQPGGYLNPFTTYDVFYYYPSVATSTITITNSFYSATTSTEFQLPTQENCDLLSGTDKWLCQIKNTLQNIFLPSQSKVAELVESMKALNQKFPSNYLSVAYDFFAGVRSGINSTSTISFKILGNTADVDFGVLKNSTTSIAGSTQSIDGLFKGFFSLICLAGFTGYAINFGKRIF
jgi:hypothetical protein